MNKKLIALMLCLCVPFAAAGCGKDEEEESGEKSRKNGGEAVAGEYGVPADEYAESGETSDYYSHTVKHPPENAKADACGDNVTWRLDGDTLYLEGSGDMWDVNLRKDICPWWNPDDVKKVIMDNGITSIGCWAFYGHYNLEEITLSKDIKYIGGNAFEHCVSLKNIDLPDGLRAIGDSAFSECKALESIVIPDSVTAYLVDDTFAHHFSLCSSLKSAKLSKNAPDVPEGMFASCTSLETVEIPEGVVSIGKDAFSGCKKLHTAELPSTVTSIGENAFCLAAIKSAIIPGGVEEISAYAYSLSDISDVIISEGVKKIGASAFSNLELDKLYIPKSVTFIGDGAFRFEQLRDVYYAGSESDFAKIQLPEDDFFDDVKIHYNVKSPDDIDVWDNPIAAYEDAVEKYESEESFFPYPENAKENACGDNITWSYDEKSATLTISGSGDMWDYYPYDDEETETAPWAEYNEDIKNIVFEGNITSIGEYAFARIEKLEKIVLPDSVKDIGSRAFERCEKLFDITLPKELETIANKAFSYCGMDDSVELLLPENVVYIGDYAFEGCEITSLKLNDGLEYIGNEVFMCEIEELVLPDSLKYIGNSAFSFCKGFTSITFPDSLRHIGEEAFLGTDIETVKFGSGLKTLESECFAQCEGLTSVEIPEGVETIYYGVFRHCSNLEEVVLPKSLKEIHYNAFSYTALSEVSIPAGVCLIKDDAFPKDVVIEVDKNNKVYTSESGELVEK